MSVLFGIQLMRSIKPHTRDSAFGKRFLVKNEGKIRIINFLNLWLKKYKAGYNEGKKTGASVFFILLPFDKKSSFSWKRSYSFINCLNAHLFLIAGLTEFVDEGAYTF